MIKLENKLVPKHEVLSAEEAVFVLENYGITKEEMPKIQSDDAAIKDRDVKVGDIIKITRKSQTAGEALYYRVVV